MGKQNKYKSNKPTIRAINRKKPDDDRIYYLDQVEFMFALDEYKRVNHRVAPAWPEVLAVAKSLGYRQVAIPRPLPRYRRYNKKDNL